MRSTPRRRGSRWAPRRAGLLGLLVALGCDAHVTISLPPDAGVVRPVAPLGFRTASFFPPHAHSIRAEASDIEWDYLQQGGGLALGDVDGDGRVDLFASGGESGHRLFRSLGAGRYEELPWALPSITGFVSSATFADVDGDGDADLLLSHLLADRGLTLLINAGGTFTDATVTAGLELFAPPAAWSTSFSDVDGDGDLDVFVPQWLHWDTVSPRVTSHLFCNDGAGSFVDCSVESGFAAHFATRVDAGLTATFADLDEDGHGDMLLAADFRRSHVFRGDGAGTFTTNATTGFLSIDYGMGSVVSDFDGDLHLDWFVTAIDFPFEDYNSNGSRMMLGDGRGGLRDVTPAAGVGAGGWGWAACGADFDLDGDVDIFHVNGYDERGAMDGPFAELGASVLNDRSRLFLNDGAAHFEDVAAAVGVDDPDHLTATVCADLDDDGDVDIVTLAVDGPLRAYENTLGGGLHFIELDLEGVGANPQAIGARVIVRSGAHQQVAERRIDNTHTSGQSTRLHFGLPTAAPVTVEVRWPDGHLSEVRGLAADRHHRVEHPARP